MRSLANTLVVCSLLTSIGARAQEADWTTILFLAADYPGMAEKLSWTGSSDRVNVVVLHGDYSGQLNAYRMLPDTNPDHPPGECCPGEVLPCCDSEPLPLAEMGLSNWDYILQPGTIGAFLTYVAENYPARRYLISFRGGMSFSGMATTQFATELDTFTQEIGRPVDVLNAGFCLSGSVEWAYALKPHADYFVGSGNWTNPPVASRWRFYAWVRSLILDPEMDGRTLAISIPDTFAITTQPCIDAGHNCTNWGEPWAVGTYDLAAYDDVVSSFHQLNCGLLADFYQYESDIDASINAANIYSHGAPDFGIFLRQMNSRLQSTPLQATANEVVSAFDKALLNAQHQDDGYPPDIEPYGAILLSVGYFNPSYDGPFALDSTWGLVIDSSYGGIPNVQVTDLSVSPTTLTLQVGETAEIAASAWGEPYGHLCHTNVDWDASNLANIGELITRSNPATFRAAVIGSGTVTARLGGYQATTTITVGPRTGPNPNTWVPSTPPGEGCSCGGSAASMFVALALLCMRRRRR